MTLWVCGVLVAVNDVMGVWCLSVAVNDAGLWCVSFAVNDVMGV